MCLSVAVLLLTDACDWKRHLFDSCNKNYEKWLQRGGRFSACSPLITPLMLNLFLYSSVFTFILSPLFLRIFKAFRQTHRCYLIFMFPWCYNASFYKQHWCTGKVWIIPLLDGGGFFLLWANHNNNSRHYMMACIYHVVRGNPSCRISCREISLR